MCFKSCIRKCTLSTIHLDFTDLVNHGMVKNTKTWISRERNTTFLWIKKALSQCLRWHILRSYRFVAEVTFQSRGHVTNKETSPLLQVSRPPNLARLCLRIKEPHQQSHATLRSRGYVKNKKCYISTLQDL